MPKAVGIGGVFFRAANPASLAEWYQKHLGIDDLHKSVWQQEAGMTIFGPFSKDTDYFGRAEQQWMVNFRVDDIDGLIANLMASGIAVETRDEWNSEVGRFARFTIPKETQSSCGSRRRVEGTWVAPACERTKACPRLRRSGASVSWLHSNRGCHFHILRIYDAVQ